MPKGNLDKRGSRIKEKSSIGVVSPPPHWPASIQYISTPRYAPAFPPHVRQVLENKQNLKPNSAKYQDLIYPSKLDLAPAATTIKQIDTKGHPAFGQRGLFAAKAIPPKTFIIQYIGEIHADERPQSDYDLSLIKLSIAIPFTIPDSTSPPATTSSSSSSSRSSKPEYTYEYINIGIDASVMGNEARFVNDYRGTGEERPNAFFTEMKAINDGMPHMTIWSGKEGIPKGREILVSYGKGWWGARTGTDAGGES